MRKKRSNDIKLKRGKIFFHQDFYSVSSVLPRVIQKLEIDQNLDDHKIMQLWQDFTQHETNELVANNTFAHRITKDRKLVIAVKSAVLANELQFLKVSLEKVFMTKIQHLKKKIKGLVFELRYSRT